MEEKEIRFPVVTPPSYLRLWPDSHTQFLLKKIKEYDPLLTANKFLSKNHMFEIISDDMKKREMFYTPLQCINKWKSINRTNKRRLQAAIKNERTTKTIKRKRPVSVLLNSSNENLFKKLDNDQDNESQSGYDCDDVPSDVTHESSAQFKEEVMKVEYIEDEEDAINHTTVEEFLDDETPVLVEGNPVKESYPNINFPSDIRHMIQSYIERADMREEKKLKLMEEKIKLMKENNEFLKNLQEDLKKVFKPKYYKVQYVQESDET